MHIFFDKEEASLASIFALCESILFCIVQKLCYIIICQVAEHPLYPDCIITRLKLKILQALQVEFATLWAVHTSLIELDLCRFDKIDIFKKRFQDFLRDATDSSTAIKS